jgi:hypothetical protein
MTENHAPGNTAGGGLFNERLRFEERENTDDKGEISQSAFSLRKQRGQKRRH